MKNIAYLMLLAFIGTLGLSSCDDDDSFVEVTLTADEKSDLLFLREEEKLARDVYRYTFDKYGLTISNNISNSEQNHMDKVLVLLNQYNITDPASTEEGTFNNTALQDLYNSFILKIDSSMMDGLLVGATIEDLDIRDIELYKNRTTNTDLMEVYNSLLCGSRNHLRAYIKQIELEGGTYIPQYLNQSELDAILAVDHEQCGG